MGVAAKIEIDAQFDGLGHQLRRMVEQYIRDRDRRWLLSD
jgi:hypothetical protein